MDEDHIICLEPEGHQLASFSTASMYFWLSRERYYKLNQKG